MSPQHFNPRTGWVDDSPVSEHVLHTAARKAEYAEAERVAYAPETIPPTGRHHRAEGDQ